MDINEERCAADGYISEYKKLFESVRTGNAGACQTLSFFVAMRGSRYDKLTGAGAVRLLLVGRAVNGWRYQYETDDPAAFAADAVGRFVRSDRFEREWHLRCMHKNPYSVPECELDNHECSENKYYLSSSPFWNTAHEIWRALSGTKTDDTPDWFENIAWSNLYKVSPKGGGNPGRRLCRLTAPMCIEILKQEITLLEPTHILLPVGADWFSWEEGNFGRDVFGRGDKASASTSACTDIVCDAFDYSDIKVVVTCRPERKKKHIYVGEVLRAYAGL